MKSLVCQCICFFVHLPWHVPGLHLPTTIITVLHVIQLLVQLFQNLEMRDLSLIGTYAIILNPCLHALSHYLYQKTRVCYILGLSEYEVLVRDGAYGVKGPAQILDLSTCTSLR